MKKKLLTIGTAALFVILFFTPQAMAVTDDEDSIQIPIVYGIAYINGTLEDPQTFFPLLAMVIGYKFFVYGNFVEGTIKPAFNLLGVRDYTLPVEGYDGVKIRGSFCQFNEFEQIGETNSYHINGTIYYLLAELY